jgi:hypothetical protein
MAHAKVLADYRVPNVEKWVGLVHDSNLSAERLKHALRKQGGRPAPAAMGRKRTLVKLERGRVRVYAFAMSADTPMVVRERAAELLVGAARALRTIK